MPKQKKSNEPITKLREYRQAAGLSILRLSKMANVHYTQAWKADHGYKGNSLATKKKIAAVFGLPVYQVFPEVLEELKQMQMFITKK